MILYLKTIGSLFAQRKEVYIVACFFATVLFNTTYMSLGTYVPMVLILLGFCFLNKKNRAIQNKSSIMYVLLSVLILFATVVSGGDDFRTPFKIIVTALFTYFACMESYSNDEAKFFSLIICLSYVIYAILVIQAIGGSTEYFGRAQISILSSEIPLDPNVVSAVFVFPMIISLYNLFYGKMKLLAIVLIVLFLIAIIALGSRGATVSVITSVGIMIIGYTFTRKSKLVSKLILIDVIVAACLYALNYISSQDNLFGTERIFDFGGEDASNGRTVIWKERFSNLLYSPLWGYGANYDMGSVARGTASHNTLLQILYFSGLLGFFWFMKPTMELFKRNTISTIVKLSLFTSVFLPTFFIDTLQERTIWNFLIFYSMLSLRENAEECLIWNK